MGLGGIIEGVGSAARAQAESLRSWSHLIADAARAAPARARAVVPVPLAEAGSFVGKVDDALVHTTGWEMRDAVNWPNNGLCIERALVTAMSGAERATGSIPKALAALGASDARLGATIVAYRPSSPIMGTFNALHGAAYFETTSGRQLVIDHMLAPAGSDGVMEVADWMRTIGARADDTVLIPGIATPPSSPRGYAGIPALAPQLDADGWLREVGLLADKLDPPVRTRDRFGALIRN